MQNRYRVLFILFIFLMVCSMLSAVETDASGDSSVSPDASHAGEDDPFGDPFDQINDETEEEKEDDDAMIDPGELPGKTQSDVMISGEVGYFPVLKFKAEKKPLFVSNLITGKTDLHYSFGNIKAAGSFKLDIDPHSTILSPNSSVDTFDDLYELSINELYCGFQADIIDMKAGYFTVDWSQMNVFTLTNYFNRNTSFYFDLDLFGFHPDDFDLDVDYSLFTTNDKENDAIAGLHLLAYYSLFSLELIVSPPFFFNDQTSYIADALNTFTFPANVDIALFNSPPAFTLENIGVAARFGFTIFSLDVYLSYFHGFDNRALYTTTTILSPPENLDIEIAREYSLLDRGGISASYDLFGMIIHAEMIMSFSDPVLYYHTTSFPEPLGDVIDTKIKNIMTMEISAGFDWEIFPNFRVIFEYTDSFLLEDVPDVQKETLHGDTLFGAVHYTLPLPGSEITFTEGIFFDWSGNEITSINKLKYDFLNGFVCEFSLFYFHITEETEATSDSFKIMNKNIIAGIFFILTI